MSGVTSQACKICEFVKWHTDHRTQTTCKEENDA